ncbi:MAG: serine hydrolase domain-containing protein [Myxococcota bacterium]
MRSAPLSTRGFWLRSSVARAGAWPIIAVALGAASCRPSSPAEPSSTPATVETPEPTGPMCEAAELRDDRATQRLVAVVDLLNAPTPEAVAAFSRDEATAEMSLRWPLEEQLPLLKAWLGEAGPATICRVVEQSEDEVVGLISWQRPDGEPTYQWLEVDLDPREEQRVVEFQGAGTTAVALEANEPYGLARSTRSIGGEPLAADAEARRALVEASLTPSIRLGARDPRTVQQRMAELDVPGMSVAVIHGGKIDWAAGYGVLQAGGSTPVDTDTMFQAASMSKPLTVLAALRMVEAGTLDLDADVNTYLKSWTLPDNQHTKAQPVTIRGLASHCAGLTVHGFPGYAEGVPVPTVPQILDGVAPANNQPIRVDKPPGQGFRYSGGGTTILQLLLADVSGKSFPQVLAEQVLKPVGMRRSTYEQPLPKRFHANAAVAHRDTGKAIPGRWHTYPEMGAAGLWTRPSDLAQLLLEVRRAHGGDEAALVSPKTAQAALLRQCPGMVGQPGSAAGYVGLGFMVAPRTGDLRFGHGGGNEGFRSQMLLDVERGSGVVVMTNSDNGGVLTDEVINAVAHVYGWPAHEERELTVAPLDAEIFDRHAGHYEFVPGTQLPVKGFEITREGETLRMTFDDGVEAQMHPTGPSSFLILEPFIVPVDLGTTGNEQWVLFDGPQGLKAVRPIEP